MQDRRLNVLFKAYYNAKCQGYFWENSIPKKPNSNQARGVVHSSGTYVYTLPPSRCKWHHLYWFMLYIIHIRSWLPNDTPWLPNGKQWYAMFENLIRYAIVTLTRKYGFKSKRFMVKTFSIWNKFPNYTFYQDYSMELGHLTRTSVSNEICHKQHQ